MTAVVDNEELRAAAARQARLVGALSTNDSLQVDNLLTGTGARQSTEADGKARVRAPFNHGLVFTVRPEDKPVVKRDLLKEKLGDSRMNIFKMTKVRKSAVKDNFRAVQVDASGRDKN